MAKRSGVHRSSVESRRQARKVERQHAERAKRQRTLLMLAALALVLVVGGVLVVNTLNGDSGNGDAPDITWSSVPQDGMTLGDATAPVTIVEYADYQCPACGFFARDVLPHIVQDYVMSGKVRIEFRVWPFLSHLPLTDPGNESVQAAEAALCAGDQGQYWAYNHALFTHQNGENAGAFSRQNLITLAGDVELDTAAFASCLDQGTYQQTVIDSKATWDSAGINQTPTLVINGQTVFLTSEGYTPLRKQIDSALAAAGAQ